MLPHLSATTSRALRFTQARLGAQSVHTNAARFFASRTTALTPTEREAAILTLSGPYPWEVTRQEGGESTSNPGPSALTKTYHFLDFNQAWSFMSRVALLAEKMDHHPEWCNVYNRVEVTLTTHDCGGISEKDVEMARRMDEYAFSLLSPPKRGNGAQP